MKFISTFLLCSIILFAGCSGDNNNLVEFNGHTMGTSYTVKIVDRNLYDTDEMKLSVKREIDSILVEVNNQMSTWQKDSEISKFNSSKTTDWFPVSSDFAAVVEDAQLVSDASGGAFDITVGPLVNLWGFGPLNMEDRIPTQPEIDKAQLLCNYKNISFRKEPPALKKEDGDIYIDLSSIAKGFGVDKISDYFIDRNYVNFMVEIGGEVRTSGKNHLNENWKIGISVPDGSFEIQKVIDVNNLAVATSGDYRNYFEKNGVRYSHTIDPRNGKPIEHFLASVTVINDNCTFADAYATAIDVLGPVEGYKLAVKEKLPVFLIVKTENGFVEKMTPEFKELFNN